MVVDRDFLLKVGLDLVHSILGCIVIGCHDWHTTDTGWNDVQRELWLKFWRRLFQINIDNLFARRLLKVFVEVKWGVEKPLLVSIIILGFIFVDVLLQAINGNYSVSIFRSLFVSWWAKLVNNLRGFVSSSTLVRLLISAIIVTLTSFCHLGKILIKFFDFLIIVIWALVTLGLATWRWNVSVLIRHVGVLLFINLTI